MKRVIFNGDVTEFDNLYWDKGLVGWEQYIQCPKPFNKEDKIEIVKDNGIAVCVRWNSTNEEISKILGAENG